MPLDNKVKQVSAAGQKVLKSTELTVYSHGSGEEMADHLLLSCSKLAAEGEHNSVSSSTSEM